MTTSLEDIANPVKDGWQLLYEGMKLENLEFRCEPCSRTGSWWEALEHIPSKKHMKAAWAWQQTCRIVKPKLPPKRDFEAWEKLVKAAGLWIYCYGCGK